MQGDDPPYLSVGTAVSAKYKGAFCEAKVSKVVRVVKCKVTYKMGLGTATVSDDQIKGTLRVGQAVQAKHPEKKELVDATITKIQDCSQYTVVFDDGDITTLRRSALCLKSGRHFNESETLDQLPLTHPEHFGNPVVGGRRGRRSRQLKEDSSEGEAEEENEPDLELYSADAGRVVSIESSDKKRSKDNWFPGLVVMPSAQPTVRINVKDEYLIRSFKDGRYYTVPKKEVSEFSRELGAKVESTILAEAVEKALKYLDQDELPVHWERNSLFNMQSQFTDSEENFTDSSDDEPCEEKDLFVAQLYKFMDDASTPLNKTPTINNKDVDLYRLFRVVEKLGGYNRVTNQNKWRTVAMRLKFPNNQNIYNQVKLVYKKCLFSYESFYRTLGVTMLNHSRSSKKNRGRSLIRDKDRATPVNNSPRPEKEDFETTEKEDEKLQEDKLKTVKKLDEKKRKEIMDMSDTNSSDATDHSESIAGTSKDVTKSKRIEKIKEKKPKLTAVEKKLINDEQPKKEDKEDDKVTRSKSIQTPKSKETVGSPERKRETRTPLPDQQQATKIATGKSVKKTDDDKKRGRKRLNAEEKTTSQSDSSNTDSSTTSGPLVSVGDKLKVYYGPTHESKVTYEAKVLEIDKDASGQIYLVHYTGWNTRYDEWITPNRIAENLSATTKAKRLKQNAAVPAKATTSKTAGKRGRGMSITGRSTASEAPRSTTPSSVTSSSSRTKSPATPATTRSNRVTRQGEWGRRTRRTSAHTDLSNHSETDTDVSESESELNRTRSGVKIEEGELKTYKKKLPKSAFTSKTEKRKDDEDTEKEDDQDKLKRARKVKKLSDNNKPSEDSDDDSTSPPKGRDFDLNQIRSELKGLVKPVKVNSTDTSEKEMASSDDSTNPPESKEELEEIEEEKLEKPIEKSSSSDDIYEFKEPEPFEFEAPSKMGEDKNAKKRLVPRIFEDIEKSPSPKKKPIKSPVKMETDDKKRYRKTPTRKTDEDDDDRKEEKKVIEDPFDKLVESPSFHIGKATSEKIIENKSKVVKALNLSESLNHFQDLPDTAEEDSEDRLDLSDNEDSQLQSDGFFSESNFSKPSPESSMLDSVCVGFSTKSNDKKQKDSDDDDAIRASIQRVIAQTSLTDEDSNDTLMINQPTSSYHAKKRDVDCKISFSVISTESEDDTKSIDVKDEKKDMSLVNLGGKQISPALQETDSALLESICSQPELITTKLEETKDIKISTGTKIADSLLQKFSMIKNKQLEIKSPKSDVEKDKEVKSDAKKELKSEFDLQSDDVKLKTNETKTKIIETARPKVEPKPKSPGKSDVKQKASSPPKAELSSDSKKRSRKILSREFIEESDTDSSDSEQLVIARSDEDSQTTSFDNKLDLKESDSNISLIHPEMTDDSQSQEEERNFKFDVKKPESPLPQVPETEIKLEIETAKEEEPDSHLHSLLVCEETIPGSPAPPAEITIPESRPKNKTILEMPFASAPGSSNSKNINANIDHSKNLKEKLPQPPLVLPLENRDAHEVSTVLDNTPPTTPESTFSNLSPRGDNGGLSPNTVDNESWKSAEVEGEYSNQRRSLNTKVSPYSEEDTLMNSESNAVNKKLREETSAAPCKKRRRSCKMSDDIPAKRGRKPLNRSRHNSDSDDTSEHSVTGSTVIGSTSGYDRITRSPRPSKYNFFVELDPNLDSGQRIAVLQQKLAELRKTYADVKAELATIERRRKKLRRREREAMKAAKQEMACT